nr:MAG TPA: hypothetical protein [Caudoviricetes sp.]
MIFLFIVLSCLRYVSRGSLPFDTTKIRQMFHTTKFLVKIITHTYI